MRSATHSDWKTEPLPSKHTVIALDRHFSPEEMTVIRRGVIPEAMEDKWFIYENEAKLYFHRSWTGYCVYVVSLEADTDGVKIVKALVNRDPEQYEETNDEADKATISFLIDVVLLHRSLEFPGSESSEGNRAIMQLSQVGRAGLGEHPKDQGDQSRGMMQGVDMKINTPQRPIQAAKALFIKLEKGGSWERECIQRGTLRLGYYELPHNLCLSSDWGTVKAAFPSESDQGSITRHINQVQQFYEEPDTTLWITFHSDRLWWCFSSSTISYLPDRSKVRYVIDQWRDTDINGNLLIKSHLSEKLLAVQSFQGTICSIKERDYLLHKINGTSEPHVNEAQAALDKLIDSLIPIVKNLHPKDLETLTDLIFRQAGWQRTGVAGEVEKDIDLDLISPIDQERIAVQVKSKASFTTYQDYQQKFSDMRGFSRFYFVTHSPHSSLSEVSSQTNDGAFIFWGAEQLAQQVARNGLIGWLIDRAS